VAEFRQRLKSLGAQRRITREDLEEYIALLGGNVSGLIARLKQSPPRQNVPYTEIDPYRAVARVIADHLPEDVFAARRMQHEAAIVRLERDRHGVSVIGLPPLGHRKAFRRRAKAR
jgi:hypothetical protein